MFETANTISELILNTIQSTTKDIQVTVNEEDEGFVVTAKLGGVIPDVKEVFDTKEEAHKFLEELEQKVLLNDISINVAKIVVSNAHIAIIKGLTKLKNL